MTRMSPGKGDAFTPPIYRGDQDEEMTKDPPLPLNRGTSDNRGKLAKAGSGPVEGSGASAGGGGNKEDYDDDPAGGGGKF
jgi:hypothetical protein